MASLATIPHYVLGVGAFPTAVVALARYSKKLEEVGAVQVPSIHLCTALRLSEN